MTAGRLVYVMGPSGAGKDSVMAFARASADPSRTAFAHRYVTRPARADAENHVALSEAEFLARQRAGWFALHWESHGLHYGIGREIDLWRESGLSVVVNGSRIYLPEAARLYPDLLPVLVTAPAEVCRARLEGRSRESDGEIRARAERKIDLDTSSKCIVTIDNSGPLEAAGAALLDLLQPRAFSSASPAGSPSPARPPAPPRR